MLTPEQQIYHQLEKSKNILIVFPVDRNNDALSASLALFLFLKKMEKEVEVVMPRSIKQVPDLSFLPSYSEIKNDLNNLRRFVVSLNISQAKINQIRYTVDNDQLNFIISPASGWFKPEDVTTRAGEFKFDLIITVGASDLESLSQVYDDNIEFFYKTTIINIDHQSANEEFGQINLIDLNAITNSEIVFSLLNSKPEIMDENIATCLLAGIIQQTKNFKSSNLTPRILLTTSQLISLNARREEIINHLYRSRNISSLKLWGKILNNLKSENNDNLIWSKLNLADLGEIKYNNGELDDIVDELIASIPNAKIIVIFFEEEKNKTKILIYSLKNINVLELIKNYLPTGNPRSAQALIDGDLKTTSISLIAELRLALDKLE